MIAQALNKLGATYSIHVIPSGAIIVPGINLLSYLIYYLDSKINEVGEDLFFHDYEKYGYSEEDFDDNVVADAEWEEIVEPKELPVLEMEEE